MKQLLNPKSVDIWNRKDVESPPFVTLDYSNDDYKHLISSIDYILFNDSLNQFVKILEQSESLYNTEKTLLVKLIYKNWNCFRRDRSMQFIKRLKTLMTSFENLKIVDLLKRIKDLSISSETNSTINHKLLKHKSLPSRELYQFLLVRIYSSFRLFHYIIDLIKFSIYPLVAKSIANGIYLPNNVLFTATLARIYCFFKSFSVKSSIVYNNLRNCLNLFKATNIEWNSDFDLDKLPNQLGLKVNTMTIEVNSIDSMQFIDSKSEDLGERIEREDVPSKSPSLFFKKLQKSLKESSFQSFQLFLKCLRKKVVKLCKNKSFNSNDHLQSIINNKMLFKNNIKTICDQFGFEKKTKKTLKSIHSLIKKETN
jgi:hypothetical protein